jgi:hypothetical protein
MKLEKWEILKKIDLDIFFQKSKFSRQQLGYFLVGFFIFSVVVVVERPIKSNKTK